MPARCASALRAQCMLQCGITDVHGQVVVISVGKSSFTAESMENHEQEHVLSLDSIQTSGSQLNVRYSYDKYQFTNCYWYDFDLESLEKKYGSLFMEKIYFNCAAFAMHEVCSLRPDVVNWGSYAARWHTAEFERVWKTMWHKLAGQWRYENMLPFAKEPRFASEAVKEAPLPASNVIQDKSQAKIGGTDSPPKTLLFFGGGKDSLAMTELFSKAGIPFSTLSYSHTMYGRSAVQHGLNDAVLELIRDKERHHKLNILDTVLDSPVMDTLGKSLGVSTFAEAETTSSVVLALPLLLNYGYTAIAIANERSANVGNLIWDVNGEDINHQWVKSKESELLLGNYLKEALLSDFSYFSVLMPIHDAVIFHVAGLRPDAVVCTHSCNITWPWCKRCAKCCYVWLNFMAYYPRDLVDGMFEENLLDCKENENNFVFMLGLGSNKPFECIGDLDEAKLAFELCRRKGIEGNAMDIYKEKVLPTLNKEAINELVEKYTSVYTKESSNIPREIWKRLHPVLEEAGAGARKEIEMTLEI